MSGIVWATLSLEDTEIDNYESVGRYVADAVREKDNRQFEVQHRPSRVGPGKVVVKYAGYAFTDEEKAEDKLLWLEHVQHVQKAVLMGYSDTSNAGWGYVLEEGEEDWMSPRVAKFDGVEGARGRDVQDEISDEHGVSPEIPHFE